MRRGLARRPAYWTFDDKASATHGIRAYYFAPVDRAEPPYLRQCEVTAILDIASDGTLAGVELVLGDLPPPPAAKSFAAGLADKLPDFDPEWPDEQKLAWLKMFAQCVPAPVP
jgi:hypothetical protein